ncbi:hypothetical protein ACH5RR_028250 [Cinchona calisaya]|uniref:Retrovirus-related Pol polyprotein from transposon TNT 1-94-like beta-barrel domain-containing protein n=1 Tax=Cinchona calisaya TaxID=153742 RepID=A0ABD2YQ65_9GENT
MNVGIIKFVMEKCMPMWLKIIVINKKLFYFLVLGPKKIKKMKGSLTLAVTITCVKKNLFSNLNEYFRSYMKFVNNEKVPILGKGKIRITLKDRSSNFISDVFYVPSIYHNLLSLGQLSEKGYDLHFKYCVGTITDDKLGLIAKVNMNRSRL